MKNGIYKIVALTLLFVGTVMMTPSAFAMEMEEKKEVDFLRINNTALDNISKELTRIESRKYSLSDSAKRLWQIKQALKAIETRIYAPKITVKDNKALIELVKSYQIVKNKHEMTTKKVIDEAIVDLNAGALAALLGGKKQEEKIESLVKCQEILTVLVQNLDKARNKKGDLLRFFSYLKTAGCFFNLSDPTELDHVLTVTKRIALLDPRTLLIFIEILEKPSRRMLKTEHEAYYGNLYGLMYNLAEYMKQQKMSDKSPTDIRSIIKTKRDALEKEYASWWWKWTQTKRWLSSTLTNLWSKK